MVAAGWNALSCLVLKAISSAFFRTANAVI